jgi:hypothetical protein
MKSCILWNKNKIGKMGISVSQVFRSGSALLSNREATESTVTNIEMIFEILRANPKISIQRLETVLIQIPKVRIL